MGPVGVQEMIVIFLVALVLFGPKKLPELGRTIGKAITEFRRAQSELKSTLQSHMKELEKETESIKEVTRSYTNEIANHYDSNSSQQYDSPYYDSGSYGSYDYNSPPAESNPSTVGATATQGAESNASHEATGNGTVPRTTTSESGNVAAGEHAEEPKVPEHATANPEGQSKPEAAVS
jgi:sec-independent protein translocase protein TatA